jgi:hypothetical protein
MLTSKQGLNVAELCISIFILSSVIVMIIGILCSGLSGIKKGEDGFITGNIIKTRLEYYSETALYKFNDFNGVYLINKDKIVDGVNVKEEWISFTDTVDDNENKLKEVTISIYWYDKNVSGHSGIKKKMLSTWINNYLD